MKALFRIWTAMLIMSIVLAGCGTSNQPNYNRVPTPASTVIVQDAPSPVAVTSPPAMLVLNQPYEYAPFRITVTQFNGHVDPNIPDIKNAAPWLTLEGYRWIFFDCLVENIAVTPIAPDFGLMGNPPNESYTDVVNIINGYNVTGVTSEDIYRRYLRIATIAPHTTASLRIYFYLQEQGLAGLVIGPFDPTQSVFWNANHHRAQYYFAVELKA